MLDGSKIKQLRKGAGKTTIELGEAVGVTSSMITYIEKEFKTPSLATIARMADYFGVTVDYLMKKEKTV